MDETVEPVIKEEMVEPVVMEDNCDNLQLSGEQYHFGQVSDPLVEEDVNGDEPLIKKEHFDGNELLVKKEFLEGHEHFERSEPLIKEECYETNYDGNTGSSLIRTMLNAVDGGLCAMADSTSTLSNGLDVIEINNGVRSVSFLSEGTEFGPYPDISYGDARWTAGEVDWPSSMRESCRKEQHNIEAVRRGGQVYYRTVTDIQPKTELVLSGSDCRSAKAPNCQELSAKEHHMCLVCSKYFSKKYYLKEHEKVHSGEKSHECDICGKFFRQRSHLTTHRSIHTGEKPHKCPICGKCFSLKGSVTTHQVIHTGEKPHKCEICNKCFALKSSLKRHEHLMHSGRE